MAACEFYLKLLPRCRLFSSFLRNPNIMIKTTSYQLHTSPYNLKRRKTAEEKKSPRILEFSPKSKAGPPVGIWKNMTVQDLASAMDKDIDHVYEVFMYVDNSEHYDSPDSVIDNIKVIQETLKKSGKRYHLVAPPNKSKDDSESKNKDITRRPPSEASKLVPRPPVVTVMGHVDHGKTTLLDTLRNSRVVDSEFGGITQHIGAFSVVLPGKSESITFLDTPGHAAFTSMRARGADATDIVLLVVAADDGVMEQTVESIRMAHEAQVPIIVAINKIDKPEADIARTKDMLLQQGMQLEESGGDIQSVPISALKGTNMPQLVEAIALQAELMELKADPTGFVEGLIIESKKDAQRGKLSTTLVQRGTLRTGCVLVSGLAWVKVRAMFDDAGRPVHEAPPSTPVEILGWRDLPMAGDDILEVESEKVANEVVKYRETLRQQKKQYDDKDIILAKAEEHRKVYRAQLEAKWKMGRYKVKRIGPREKEMKNEDTGPCLNVVLKGDVGGSLEAIMDVLECYDNHEQCKLSLVHYGVGNVTENDIELAGAFKGLVYAFNVDTPKNVKIAAKSKNILIKPHNVLYKMIDDIKEEISQRLPPKQVEDITGEANVLQFFEVTEGKKKVSIAGSRCTKGVLKKGVKARVFRNGEVLYEGSVSMLRHLKDEVSTIKKDVECGIKLDDIAFEFKPGDLIQCYSIRDENQKCEWDPGF